ncbi:MAG: hypothetical protein AAB403_00440 [Planctomycetota bacterium]
MSSRNKNRACVYCGQVKKLTADHVPPKSLLAQPYPTNLLTVPACGDCNASFQLDDEYTRTVVSMDVRASKNHDAQSQLPAIIRSLQRPNAKAFADYLTSQMAATRILAPDGVPMGQAIEVDRRRVHATGARIIRGLFYVEKGKPVPPGALLRVEATAGLNSSDPVVLQFARLYGQCSERRDREIGKAFSYAAGFGPGFSIWLMLLYDYFAWAGTVDMRSTSADLITCLKDHPELLAKVLG